MLVQLWGGILIVFQLGSHHTVMQVPLLVHLCVLDKKIMPAYLRLSNQTNLWSIATLNEWCHQTPVYPVKWSTPPTDPDTKYSHGTRLTKLIQVIAFLIDIQWSKHALTTLGFWKAFRCNYQLHTPVLYKGSTKRHGYYCVNWAGRIYWVFACHTVLQECHHGSADLAGLVFLYWTFYSCTVVNIGCCQPQERSG